MSLFEKFNNHITEKKLFSKKDKLLLAVSGGVDSMVLLELMKVSGFNIEVAHCNFQLRGIESDADEDCVRKTCSASGLQIHLKRFDTALFAEHHKLSIQVAARELRYQWFNEMLNENKFVWILTAHHANDNVETIMMNFFKGTGIVGLAGMKEKGGGIGGKLLRPLLYFHKSEILAFATERNLIWREDASNSINKYTRNFFRNELLPSVAKVYPEVEANLMNNVKRFSDAAIIYKKAIEEITSRLIEKKGEEIHVSVLKLIKTPAFETVYYEIISQYGFTSEQLKDALSLLESETGKYISSSSHRIIRNRQWIVIVPNADSSVNLIVIEKEDASVLFGHQKLMINKISEIPEFSSDSTKVVLDWSTVKFPLILRKWKQGDYFYPLGMQKKKKLSRFFIDNKLSLSDKEKVWLLESEKKIIWVLGLRIDDRFKVTPQTHDMRFLQILPAD